MKYHISLLASPFKTFSCHSVRVSRLLFQTCYTFKCNLLAWIFSLYLRPRCQIYCVRLRDGAQKNGWSVTQRALHKTRELGCFFSLCVCVRAKSMASVESVGSSANASCWGALNGFSPADFAKFPLFFHLTFLSSLRSHPCRLLPSSVFMWGIMHEALMKQSSLTVMWGAICFFMFLMNSHDCYLDMKRYLFFFPSLIFPFSPAP